MKGTWFNSLLYILVLLCYFQSSRLRFIDALHVGVTNFRVPSKGEECVFNDVSQSQDKVYIHYTSNENDMSEMNVRIFNPEGLVFFKAEKNVENRILFRAPIPGTYVTCFDNRQSHLGEKTVTYQSQVGSDDDISSESALTSGPHQRNNIEVMEASLLRILGGLEEVETQQKYLVTREKQHRKLVENTKSRIFFWGLSGITMVLGTTFLQLHLIKRSFDSISSI